MKPNDEAAQKVWETTLPEIRRKRRQRELGKKVLLASASACIAWGAWLLSSRPSTMVTKPTSFPEPVIQTQQTFAVMKVGIDGNTVLQELSDANLGDANLSFGLTQFVFEDATEPEGQMRDGLILFQ